MTAFEALVTPICLGLPLALTLGVASRWLARLLDVL